MKVTFVGLAKGSICTHLGECDFERRGRTSSDRWKTAVGFFALAKERERDLRYCRSVTRGTDEATGK
jgi:hypothetical protein